MDIKFLRIYILEIDENTDLKSPGMSLETFIARDFSVMEHNLQAIETEEKEENNDEPLETTEKITTEDILGIEKISFPKKTEMFSSDVLLHR
jgi:hypothetical protein